jgi:hypothetical protein
VKTPTPTSWGSRGRRFKSCRPDQVFAGRQGCLSKGRHLFCVLGTKTESGWDAYRCLTGGQAGWCRYPVGAVSLEAGRVVGQPGVVSGFELVAFGSGGQDDVGAAVVGVIQPAEIRRPEEHAADFVVGHRT